MGLERTRVNVIPDRSYDNKEKREKMRDQE
jgi:hypothetical protein